MGNKRTGKSQKGKLENVYQLAKVTRSYNITEFMDSVITMLSEKYEESKSLVLERVFRLGLKYEHLYEIEKGVEYQADYEDTIAKIRNSSKNDLIKDKEIISRLIKVSVDALINITYEEQLAECKPITMSMNELNKKISALVADHKEACIEFFKSCGLKIDRVELLANGSEPTQRELGVLHCPLEISHQELQDLYQKEFGSNDTSENGIDHIDIKG